MNHLKLLAGKNSVLIFVPVLILSLAALFTQNSYAQTFKKLVSSNKQIIYFDLPSQTLKNGLIEFAIQSKLNIIVEADLVSGFRSKPIVGPHQPEKALRLLLSKAPLTFTVLEESQSILIQPSIEKINSTAPLQSNTEAATNSHLDEIIINGSQFPFRYNTISNTQIYGNTSTFSSSRFINALPPTLITDQAPDDIGDLLKLSSGITPGDGFADSNDDFYIRGFRRYGLYLDGFRLSADSGTKLHAENIERIEVLKGPSTLFYGQAEPGGIINAISKKPQHRAHKKLGLSKGSNNEQRAYIDFTGPIIDSNQTLLYRLVASRKSQDSYRDLTNLKSTFWAPSLTWFPSKDTIIDISYNKQKSEQTREQGSVVLAPLRQDVDIVSVADSNTGNKARPSFNASQEISAISLQHYFSNNWSIKNTLNKTKEARFGIRGERDALYSSDLLLDKDDLDPNSLAVRDGLIVQGTSIGKEQQWLPVAVIRSIYDEISKEQSSAFTSIINGDYQIGNRSNELTVGLNWNKRDIYEEYILEQRNDIQSLDLAPRGSSAILEAVEAIFIEDPSLGALSTKQQTLNYTDRGVFLLNNTQLNDSWKLSLGGRYTSTKGSQQGTNSASPNQLTTYNQLSTELGLNYQPTDEIALYFNYSEGFKANYQADDIGTQLTKPELSKQLELGIKTLMFEDTFSTTVALFQIDKKNVVDIKFIEGVRTASILGRQSTQGLDMDFTYQISKRMNLLGSLALTDPTIDTGDNKGNTPELASKKVASLFINYALNSGLSCNLGAYYVGKRYSNNDNNIHSKIASFYTLDTGLAYQTSSTVQANKTQYRFHIGIKNILDKRYILATEGRLRSSHGAGKRILASLSVKF